MKNKVMRKCVSCREIKNRDEMLKITKINDSKILVLNPNSKIFGRSAYLCYNKTCIEEALKKNKLEKSLKINIPQEFKEQIRSKEY